MNSFYAVLAGDIIDSGRLNKKQLENVRSTLCGAAEEIGRWRKGLVLGSADFFRGDAWQMLLADPRWALRAALLIRAVLRAGGLADSRVVAGLGSVDHVDTRRISLSTGQAFALAGRRLDSLARLETMDIVVPEAQADLGGWLLAVSALCGVLAGGWTRRQAQVLRLALSPGDPHHADIARQLKPPVSQQSVTKTLNSAGWHGVRPAVRKFETADWERLLVGISGEQP